MKIIITLNCTPASTLELPIPFTIFHRSLLRSMLMLSCTCGILNSSAQQPGGLFYREVLSNTEKKLNLKTSDAHPHLQPLAAGLETNVNLDTALVAITPLQKKICLGALASIGGGYQLASKSQPLGGGLIGVHGSLQHVPKWSADLGYSLVGGMPSQYLRDYMDSLRISPGAGYAVHDGNGLYHTHYTYGHLAYSNGKHFHFEIGKGKHFWGDGYRSMILSDNASSYPYARITTKVWKLKYTNLWTQMRDLSSGQRLNRARIKYTAMHALSFNAGRKFNFSIYEMVVWQDRDTMSRRTLDINYLNPIIFYRPVEYSVGSPDNVILAASMKWKPKPRIQFYGQFVLDEFNLKQFQGNKKWWANKLGGQFGFKLFDVFIPNLNLQSEVNIARPFTYTHGSPIQSWTHLNQSLAHPMGCNFIEWVSFIRYDTKSWKFLEQFTWAAFGRDRDVNGDGVVDNLGGNILRSYKDPYEQYGHEILQGNKSNFYYHAFTIAHAIPGLDAYEAFVTHTIRYDQNQTRTQLDNYIMLGIRFKGMLTPSNDF